MQEVEVESTVHDPYYKHQVVSKINEFIDAFPEYSIGQILYSMLTTMELPVSINKSLFLEMSDDEIYRSLDRAIRLERE